MKNRIQTTTLICLILLSLSTYGKSQSGIYLTAADYEQKHLSYETKNAKIHLNNSVWEMPYITVTERGKKHRLSKSEVYAYVDKGNEVFRFYKSEEYLIAEAGNINVYVQAERISQSKGYQIKMHYYFSTAPEGEIIPLTIGNIKKANSSNEHFIALLEQFFSNDDVTAYDKIHNTFKVNYVYTRAKQ